MAVTNSIFLYNGRGANSICVSETELQLKNLYGSSSIVALDASYFKRESPPSLYVLPGGEAGVMGAELQDEATKIRDAVNKGSGLLGLCAGALFASSYWQYNVPVDPEKSLRRLVIDREKESLLGLGPIALLPAIYDGNFPGVKAHVQADLSRIVPVHLPETDKVIRCFWNQGPGFSDWGGNVIAEYKCAINPALKLNNRGILSAITNSRIGRGNVVFSGVHPELARWANGKGLLLSEEELKANDQLFETCCTLAGALSSSQ